MYYAIQPTNRDIEHSRGPWKKHKYLKKIGKRYVYKPDNYDYTEESLSDKTYQRDKLKYKLMTGKDYKSGTTYTEYKLSRFGNKAYLVGTGASFINPYLGIAIDSIGWTAHNASKGLKRGRRIKETYQLNKAHKTSMGKALLTAGKRFVSKLLKKVF